MRVLRIEHMSLLRHGRPAGPYADDVWGQAEHDDDSDWYQCTDAECGHNYIDSICGVTTSRRPMPRNDGLYSISTDELFAFSTPEQMWKWFAGDLRKLHRIGYLVGIYDVPDNHARHGRRQSVFSWDEAERVGEASIFSKNFPLNP